jgi:hypothetical protein
VLFPSSTDPAVVNLKRSSVIGLGKEGAEGPCHGRHEGGRFHQIGGWMPTTAS